MEFRVKRQLQNLLGISSLKRFMLESLTTGSEVRNVDFSTDFPIFALLEHLPEYLKIGSKLPKTQ